MCATLVDPQDNQRKAHRQRVLKGGKILFNRHSSTINCVVRDESDGGARLKVDTILGIPDTFDLQVMDRPARPCMVVWKSNRELGVVYVAQ